MKKKVLIWLLGEQSSDQTAKFLILKTIPERGGYWQPVTGSVEDGESYEDAALREVFEETGVKKSDGLIDLDYLFEYQTRGNDITEKCFAVVVSEAELSQPLKLEPKEHVEYKWVNESEAGLKIKYDSNRAALNRAVKFVRAQESHTK